MPNSNSKEQKQKIAFITGITGQDGSYLADFLLEKGYKVYGMVRRTSTPNFERLSHILDKIELVYGDLLDQSSITALLQQIQPDEIYNLAAQSFVKDSWNEPLATGEFTALGVLRVLEAMRQICPKARFYQASSSEMFGSAPAPQSEKTKFEPRSPYAVSKVFGHYITVNYRESYGLFACSGILFNHECLTARTPILIRRHGMIDIRAIEEIVPHRENPRHGTKYTTTGNDDLEIWDGDKWSKIKTLTATWNKVGSQNDKQVRQIISRGGYYEATGDHISFLSDKNEIETKKLKTGDKLALKYFPQLNSATILSVEEAEFLGMMIADGYISKEGKGRFINNSKLLSSKIDDLWQQISGGYSRTDKYPSGFNKDKNVSSVELVGNRDYLKLIHREIYNERGFKKIPKRVLNSQKQTIIAFLRGYNNCDGLKAGNQKTEFKSFNTNSTVLALGLWYLVDQALNLRITIHPEFREDYLYFHLNINSGARTQKGKHLQKEIAEVKANKKLDYNGWLFDLETESGTFSAGVGLTWVHNSPRRGIEFVTRKISDGVARIKLGLAKEINLGNLDAKRDWGFAGDYVKAMWLMLQQDKPDDYVIGTGVNHTVRDFVEAAFTAAGIKNFEKYVKIDPKFMRPADVMELRADAVKAKKKLGWEPKTSFDELVKMMVEHDTKQLLTERIKKDLDKLQEYRI